MSRPADESSFEHSAIVGQPFPPDLQAWLVQWRNEWLREMRDIRAQISAVAAQLNDGKFLLQKHDEQLHSLIEDLVETDHNAKSIEQRLKDLETNEKIRADQNDKAMNGPLAKFREQLLTAAIWTVTGGVIAFVWYLVTQYAKQQAP